MTYESVMAGLQYSESLYSDLKIQFVTTELIYSPVESSDDCILHDIIDHKDSLNIYVFTYIPLSGMLGLGSLPEFDKDRTIFIYCRDERESIYTISHEIGHSICGLRHTFEEDWCADTPELPPYSTENIMDYSGSTSPYVTEDQIKRAKFMFYMYNRHLLLK